MVIGRAVIVDLARDAELVRVLNGGGRDDRADRRPRRGHTAVPMALLMTGGAVLPMIGLFMGSTRKFAAHRI